MKKRDQHPKYGIKTVYTGNSPHEPPTWKKTATGWEAMMTYNGGLYILDDLNQAYVKVGGWNYPNSEYVYQVVELE